MSSDWSNCTYESDQALSSHYVNVDGSVNEQGLLGACRSGDRAALDFLIRHYARDIYAGVAKAWATCRRPACDRDELAQEVCLKIIEAPDERLSCAQSEVSDLSRWLRVVARNLALNTLESRGVFRSGLRPGPRGEYFHATEDCDDLTVEIEDVRASLSDPSRAVFDLRLGWGTSAEPNTMHEIARKLGKSISWVYYKFGSIKQRILRRKSP
jgi:DNA-directed RNA polymerase specialized sigma24 family protein